MEHQSKSIRKWVLALLAVAFLLVFLYFLDVQELFQVALAWISDLGPWGPVFFIVFYILATVLFLPGLIPTMAAGVLFGVIRGTLLVSISSISGAILAFLIGRYLAREWVAAMIRGNQKFEAIDAAVAEEGWKIVGLTRLSPVFPFNLLNYAFGLTQVSLKDYFLASWIGMLPGTVMYVYIGSLAGNLASLGSGERSRTSAEWALYGVGLMATVVLTLYLTRIAQRALKRTVT
ncbi:MAG: TVP38/TMEM64 family protein [Acidobacteria bacterium]|nr:MAG: TVP38/TMEM64 family protein [Acidobacteriota bacterium]TDI15582.1 MAG: TVP38/TMEM64 family protein [Acidobacteriota bacterium]